MLRPFKDLSLGLLLIALVSGALLFSDRSGGKEGDLPRVAILKFASSPLYDDLTKGILEGLATRGYGEGGKATLQLFNPEGDISTANLIAKQVTDGTYKVTITTTTVGLQAVASANSAGKTTQVFCAVSAPTVAGVGIEALDSLKKPAHLTGIGTAQPVEEIFKLAKRIKPDLKRVGVVWNPAEANSEHCTKRARAICKELGIELLEASIEGTRDIREAAQSLASKNVEAYWTGCDATVINGFDVLANVAKQNGIAIFSNTGGHTSRGALFDLGANYHQVGYRAGEIAAGILDGTISAAELPVSDYMPKELRLNPAALNGLRSPWHFSPELLKEASIIVQSNP